MTRAQLTALIADNEKLPLALRLGLPVALTFLNKQQVSELGDWIEKTIARIEAGEIDSVLEEFRQAGAFESLKAAGIDSDFIEGVRKDGAELGRAN